MILSIFIDSVGIRPRGPNRAQHYPLVSLNHLQIQWSDRKSAEPHSGLFGFGGRWLLQLQLIFERVGVLTVFVYQQAQSLLFRHKGSLHWLAIRLVRFALATLLVQICLSFRMQLSGGNSQLCIRHSLISLCILSQVSELKDLSLLNSTAAKHRSLR